MALKQDNNALQNELPEEIKVQRNELKSLNLT